SKQREALFAETIFYEGAGSRIRTDDLLITNRTGTKRVRASAPIRWAYGQTVSKITYRIVGKYTAFREHTTQLLLRGQSLCRWRSLHSPHRRTLTNEGGFPRACCQFRCQFS